MMSVQYVLHIASHVRNWPIGRWKGAGGSFIPWISLETSVKSGSSEDNKLFLSFVRSMLQWLPEKRKPASELLKIPWIVQSDS